jgi:aminoglycoside phosphotransferase (APT) family kinase protein
VKENINTALVEQLIASQFPQWKDLPIRPVQLSGWDNRTFHLGSQMLVRMPSAAIYAAQVEKEQKWLPKLKSFLPLGIPVPLAMGEPGEGYPWKWSIYQWLEGESAASARIDDLKAFAKSLSEFLTAFQRIDTKGAPLPGAHNFYRGGALSTYDAEARHAIAVLEGKIDRAAALQVWEKALASSWQKAPVWVHGDISAGNLLLQEGKLSAVIDFGQLAIGDPACDLAIAWTFFQKESRQVFRQCLSLDEETWSRAMGWTLWKALVVAAGFTNPNNLESMHCWRIIEELI